MLDGNHVGAHGAAALRRFETTCALLARFERIEEPREGAAAQTADDDGAGAGAGRVAEGIEYAGKAAAYAIVGGA